MATTERRAKRAKLLSDEDSSDESDSQEEQPTSTAFRINEDYASRFEHNKKREEKHRLEEKYSQPNKRRREEDEEPTRDENEDDDSEDDESEDDDAELATRDLDDEIFATLQAIKSKDPRVYDKSTTFYKSFDADNGVETTESERMEKDRPMYLHDYHRQNLIAGHTGAEDDRELELIPMTYQEEQDAMRRDLVGSMHASAPEHDLEDDEDDFLVAKSKSDHGRLPDAQMTQPRITDRDVEEADKDPETYLSNFMASRAWLPTEGSRWAALESDNSDDDARAEEFEEAYNMRFEDPATANEKLLTFGRDVGKYGARRDEKTSRKRAREREREQKDAAKRERDEERARLRKLKIEEAEDKVKKIKHAAGLHGTELDVEAWRDVIEGEFDDEKWEAEMRWRFGEDYYAEREDNGSTTGRLEVGKKHGKLSKPTWNDDIDINDIVPDFDNDDGKPAFTLSSDEEADEGDIETLSQPPESNFEEPERKKAKTKKDREKEKAEAKRTARRERRQIEELVDNSILPLSHPTLLNNIPGSLKQPAETGLFRYRETSPTSFGLSARDILFADDSRLNEYAGLKKLAAFRDPEKKRRDKKRFSKKARLRQWRAETFGGSGREQPGIEDPSKANRNKQDVDREAMDQSSRIEGIAVTDVGDARKAGKKRKRTKRKQS